MCLLITATYDCPLLHICSVCIPWPLTQLYVHTSKGYFDAALLILIPEETFLERILFWSPIKPPLELVNYLSRCTSHWHMTSPTGIHTIPEPAVTRFSCRHSPYCWPSMPGHLSTWTRTLTHSSPYAYRPGFVLVVVSRKFLSKVTHAPLKGHFCTHSWMTRWWWWYLQGSIDQLLLVIALDFISHRCCLLSTVYYDSMAVANWPNFGVLCSGMDCYESFVVREIMGLEWRSRLLAVNGLTWAEL